MITMKDIIREGHPALRRIADQVPLPPSQDDQQVLHDLLQYVQNSQDPEKADKYGLRPGIGLAAPQINISKQMIAVSVTDGKGNQYEQALFNPKIVSHSIEKAYLTSGEGCLSVDRPVPGYVPRYARITVKGYDIKGNEVKLRLKGLPAIVFQHEIDHLNGIMFYDLIDQNNPLQPLNDATPVER
ncbi:peptide deformylase [Bacillus sp. 2205SS5-2]|uniref:peptide deformylase n=1 Tax=Bacillus sp. 2205SS5-2 TaxID=3109031 RepID=UPI003003E87C